MDNYSLDKNTLGTMLESAKCGLDLYFFEETTSTFDEALRIMPKSPALIVARRQTLGRGRLGRTWQSDEGGIYLSLVIKPCVPNEKLSLMTAICALGIKRAIENYTECKIKWPNDIVSKNGKKLCGILTKLGTYPQDNMINVGIGINANNENFQSELKYASSISLEVERKINENALTASVAEEIMKICANADVDDILSEYRDALINLDKRIRLVYPNGKGEECGLCIGIDDMCALIVQRDDGTRVALSSGEVSVRGVYGEYV